MKTIANGINNNGQIVGTYVDLAGNRHIHTARCAWCDEHDPVWDQRFGHYRWWGYWR